MLAAILVDFFGEADIVEAVALKLHHFIFLKKRERIRPASGLAFFERGLGNAIEARAMTPVFFNVIQEIEYRKVINFHE